jgi:hypothetical protein
MVGRENTQVEIWVDIAPINSETPIFEIRGKIEIGESITNL